jgi:hypothetical protein
LKLPRKSTGVVATNTHVALVTLSMAAPAIVRATAAHPNRFAAAQSNLVG